MAIEKKTGTQKVSYRLQEKVGHIVNGLASRTGWTESFAAGFLVSLGYAAMRGRAKEIDARRKVVEAQMFLAKVQREAAEQRSERKKAQTIPPAPAAAAAAPKRVARVKKKQE